MIGFLGRRLVLALFTAFVALTLVFGLVRIVPGDPAVVILGDSASEAALQALRERLGLNLPLWLQYLDFLRGALWGNWGVSMVTGRPVIEEIFKVLPWTIELTIVSLFLGAVIGIPLGVWAAVRRNQAID